MRKFFDENNYPMDKEYILRNSIRKIGFWEMIKRNSIENKLRGLRKRYSSRKFLPFAVREDNDDVACFEEGQENKVFIIHDYASDGWEQRKIYDDIVFWVREVLKEYTIENLEDQGSKNKLLGTLTEIFSNINAFARTVEEIDIMSGNIRTYFYDHKYYFTEIGIIEKEGLSKKDAFAKMFKEELFRVEEWDRNEDEIYRKKGWHQAIERFWIPQYFLSWGEFVLEGVSIYKYKEIISDYNSLVDDEGNTLYIDLSEFENSESARYKKGMCDEKVFIETKNYYLIYESGMYN